MQSNLLRGKQAYGSDLTPEPSGGAAPSPTLHTQAIARAVVHGIAAGFGRDEPSQRAGYAAAQRGARWMSECPPGLDKLSFYMGVLAWRRHRGVPA